MPPAIALCRSDELAEGGPGVCFEVLERGQTQPAFAVRFGGRVHAYINRCTHIPMTLDFLPGQFFDSTGQWLICASHGALFAPESGQCRGGPCRGALVKIGVSEADGLVCWHTSGQIEPLPQTP